MYMYLFICTDIFLHIHACMHAADRQAGTCTYLRTYIHACMYVLYLRLLCFLKCVCLSLYISKTGLLAYNKLINRSM